MKIVLTANEVEEAVKKHLVETKGISGTLDVKWNEAALIHPVYPITVDVAE